MIVVTGAAGFIGSNIVADLEARGMGPIAVCDWFGTHEKWRNLAKRDIAAFIRPEQLGEYLEAQRSVIRAIVHMGAISATTERNVDLLVEHNIKLSVDLWDWCSLNRVPYIYASSAATYGGIEEGFVDDDAIDAIMKLRPLNAYGWSKKATDLIFAQRIAAGQPTPPQWIGLKFFNVYGPNEYHKDDMKSVAVKLFDQIRNGEPVKLFKSYRDGIADGEQRRDFVYVKDCTRAIAWFLDNPQVSGIFNLGTGKAQSFLDIVKAIGVAIGQKIDVEFIPMPESLRGRYQYFTQADMSKATAMGLDTRFMSLEEGVKDYVTEHLSHEDRYR